MKSFPCTAWTASANRAKSTAGSDWLRVLHRACGFHRVRLYNRPIPRPDRALLACTPRAAAAIAPIGRDVRCQNPPRSMPATGKLGVLTPGMGAVATTFYSGVLAVRKGYAVPVGILDADGSYSSRQANREAKSDDQGLRSPGRSQRSRIRWLGPLLGRCLRRRDEGRGAPTEGSRVGRRRTPTDSTDAGRLLVGLGQTIGGLRPGQVRPEQDGPGRAPHGGHREVPHRARMRAPGDGLVWFDRGVPRACPGPP